MCEVRRVYSAHSQGRHRGPFDRAALGRTDSRPNYRRRDAPDARTRARQATQTTPDRSKGRLHVWIPGIQQKQRRLLGRRLLSPKTVLSGHVSGQVERSPETYISSNRERIAPGLASDVAWSKKLVLAAALSQNSLLCAR